MTSINDWPVLTHYQGEHLRRVALPVGGIGTSTISLGGRGDLRGFGQWQDADSQIICAGEELMCRISGTDDF